MVQPVFHTSCVHYLAVVKEDCKFATPKIFTLLTLLHNLAVFAIIEMNRLEIYLPEPNPIAISHIIFELSYVHFITSKIYVSQEGLVTYTVQTPLPCAMYFFFFEGNIFPIPFFFFSMTSPVYKPPYPRKSNYMLIKAKTLTPDDSVSFCFITT